MTESSISFSVAPVLNNLENWKPFITCHFKAVICLSLTAFTRSPGTGAQNCLHQIHTTLYPNWSQEAEVGHEGRVLRLLCKKQKHNISTLCSHTAWPCWQLFSCSAGESMHSQVFLPENGAFSIFLSVISCWYISEDKILVHPYWKLCNKPS